MKVYKKDGYKYVIITHADLLIRNQHGNAEVKMLECLDLTRPYERLALIDGIGFRQKIHLSGIDRVLDEL